MTAVDPRPGPSRPGLAERLVTRLADLAGRRTSRRSFVAAAALTGTALAVDPLGYLTRPQSAYASVCGPGASCDAGWSVFCCSINAGRNTCPPNTYAGGWWKADRSSFCRGAARYYIDCNALPGHHFTCRCNQNNCDHRYVACNNFRYGQCNTQVKGVTPVVCRQISCLPPWQLYPGRCGTSSATDNNTALHSAPCLTTANSNPNLVTFPAGPAALGPNANLYGGQFLVSKDRHTQLLFGHDGNLAVKNQHGVVWQTGTQWIGSGSRLHLTATGYIQLIDRTGRVRWQNNPWKKATYAVLAVNNDGRAVVRQGTQFLWQTPTHTP